MVFIIGMFMGIFIGMVLTMLLEDKDKSDCDMCPDEDTDRCKTCDKG